MRHKKIIFTIILLTGAAIFYTQCIGKKSSNDARGGQYAGAKACVTCHQDIAASYFHTNHFKTSSKVSLDELRKLTTSSNNTVFYEDPAQVRLEEKPTGFFQSYVADGKTIRTERQDIAIGSAEKAQTYAYWKDQQLFQLPLTYFAARKLWTNSPGYPIRQPYFDRPLLSRCLECHASFASKTNVVSGPLQISEKLAPASIIYGIDCERCHGPAARHVEFHEENPTAKKASFITAIQSLSRQQQLDLCASCHSGNDLDVQRTLFAFRPGDTLANFYFPHFGSGMKEPDVHAYQMQLLQSSKCFQLSAMTCTSCHEAHRPEENKTATFISKCLSCHQDLPHAQQMRANVKSCMDCHMPLQVSKSLDFNNGVEVRSIPYMLRTHRIAVYEGDSDGF